MNFLKEIRAHINSFETEFEAELHKFIDHLETKYQVPAPAVVAPPTITISVPTAETFIAPVLNPVTPEVETTNVANSDTPVSADPAPVVDTPVVEPTPAPQPDPEPAPTTKE